MTLWRKPYSWEQRKLSNDWRRVVFIGDAHVPDHNVKVVNNLVGFVADYQPDEVICTGDFLDCKAPARWSRGIAEEFAGTLQAECDAGVKVLGMFREVYDGPFGMHKGNHPERVENYVKKWAPAFSGLRGLEVRELLEYDELDIRELPDFHAFAPGWLSTHGDKGTNLVRYAGGTAAALARRTRHNIVCGHTHRAGILPETVGFGAATKTYFGVEVGNVMDIRKADYLKAGMANWQTAFGVFFVKGTKVEPHLIFPAKDGSFNAFGQDYGA